MTTHDGPLIFRASRPKQLLLMLLALAMSGLGLWMTTRDDIEAVAAGWVCMVFFGGGVLLIVGRVLAKEPPLVLSQAGIEDRRLGAGLVPWSEIADVGLVVVKSRTFLAIELVDEDSLLARLSFWPRLRGRLNRSIGWTPWSISFNDLEPGPEAAMAYVESLLGDRPEENES